MRGAGSSERRDAQCKRAQATTATSANASRTYIGRKLSGVACVASSGVFAVMLGLAMWFGNGDHAARSLYEMWVVLLGLAGTPVIVVLTFRARRHRAH